MTEEPLHAPIARHETHPVDRDHSRELLEDRTFAGASMAAFRAYWLSRRQLRNEVRP